MVVVVAVVIVTVTTVRDATGISCGIGVELQHQAHIISVGGMGMLKRQDLVETGR